FSICGLAVIIAVKSREAQQHWSRSLFMIQADLYTKRLNQIGSKVCRLRCYTRIQKLTTSGSFGMQSGICRKTRIGQIRMADMAGMCLRACGRLYTKRKATKQHSAKTYTDQLKCFRRISM